MISSSPHAIAPAWGKVILIGEHAVVHGHKALAGAIERGLRCTAQPQLGPSRLCAPAWQIDVQVGDDHPVADALGRMLAASGAADLSLEILGDLPAAAGLGSSAALCVSIARALGPKRSDDEVVALANLGERSFHSQPSGIDVALSCRGGFGVYQRESGLEALTCQALPIVVGLSGVPRSTATMVTGVAERMSSSTVVRNSIERIGALTQDAQAALQASDLSALGILMNECHGHLQTIGVSIDILDQMVSTAREAGALGAKLTGAGGGGSMIALAPGREHEVMKALEDLGHQSFITNLGATR